jgi:non-canonical (house-cleaning) NTP pyrophosphatase
LQCPFFQIFDKKGGCAILQRKNIEIPMKKIIIINSGPLKFNVTAKAFSSVMPEEEFYFEPFEVPHEGTDILTKKDCLQIMNSSIETTKNAIPDANFYVFMRGRFEETDRGMEESAIVLIQDNLGIQSISNAVSFEVPEVLAYKLRSGTKFAKAVEETYNLKGVKEGGGYCGYLTNGVVTKSDQYFHATVIALSSLIKSQLP